MKKIAITCAVLTRNPVPTAPVVLVARRLLKIFSRHPLVLRSQPLSPEFSDLTIAFVGASRSRRLNRAYRKKDYATDVLSFPASSRHEGLGELVLCIPVLKRQARAQGHSLKREMDTMLIHGFLHLLGYDHEKSRKEELKMQELQDKLLKKLSD